MTTLAFPDTTGKPTDGSFTYEANGVIYSWTGEYWAANNAQGFDHRYVNADGDQMTGDLTVPSLNGGPLAGFRNQFINGNFQINQRNEDTLTSGGFLFDRWYWDGTGSYTRGLNTPLGQARSASFADGSTGRLQQAVELPATGKSGPFINGSQWTLSLYVKQGSFASLEAGLLDVFFRRSSTSGTDAVRAVNPAPSFTATSETSNGFIRYVCTFTIDADPHSSSECITFRFPIQSAIGAVQLEPGSQPTPFEMRPISTELALCQRYYQTPAAAFTISGFGSNAGGTRIFQQEFVTTMRAAPSVAVFDTNGTQGRVTGKDNAGGNLPNQTINVAAFTDRIEFDGGSNVVTHNGYWINWTADAEL